jgi:hypothetical protein
MHKAKALFDQDFLTQELGFLATVFKESGYSTQQIRRALEPATRTSKTNEKLTSIAFIHYIHTIYVRLSRMLAKHSIKCVSLQPRNIYTYFPTAEDA